MAQLAWHFSLNKDVESSNLAAVFAGTPFPYTNRGIAPLLVSGVDQNKRRDNQKNPIYFYFTSKTFKFGEYTLFSKRPNVYSFKRISPIDEEHLCKGNYEEA